MHLPPPPPPPPPSPKLARTEIQPGSDLLDLFVETAFACGEEDLLLFVKEMPDLAAASRLDVDTVPSEVEALGVAIGRVECVSLCARAARTRCSYGKATWTHKQNK